MKTPIKFILLSILALAALSIAIPPNVKAAEGTGPQPLYTGTQTVPITASNVTTFVTVRSREFALYTQFNLTGAGTAINRVVLENSIDNANWKPWGNWDMTANGATAVSTITNITANAIPFWRFTLHNSNSVVATNLNIQVFCKPDL